MRADLKLLDLPGVVGGSVEGEPTDMDMRTRRLVSKYLSCPDTLVLIVAEATASSVRNSSAFALVSEANKAGKSLGVLTKADGCIGPSLSRLKERLAGRSKDLPQLGHGYVSLVNRDSTDGQHLTIAQAEAVEGEWFEKHLAEHKKSHGGDVLVQKLVDMLVSYVKDCWADKALATLRAERGKFKVRRLGRARILPSRFGISLHPHTLSDSRSLPPIYLRVVGAGEPAGLQGEGDGARAAGGSAVGRGPHRPESAPGARQ